VACLNVMSHNVSGRTEENNVSISGCILDTQQGMLHFVGHSTSSLCFAPSPFLGTSCLR
jgi:hypothetical protein